MNLMKQWMSLATPDEQKLLARRVGTSRAYLYFLAADETKVHHRKPSASMAALIERETLAMHKASKGRLPKLYRTDLVPACATCPYARKCLGPIAERNDFPEVTEEGLEVANG